MRGVVCTSAAKREHSEPRRGQRACVTCTSASSSSEKSTAVTALAPTFSPQKDRESMNWGSSCGGGGVSWEAGRWAQPARASES